MRAMTDCGLTPGKDIAVCAVNGEGWSNYLNPRLTTLATPKIEPFIEECYSWIVKKDNKWQGDLCLTPSQPKIIIGESTQYEY